MENLRRWVSLQWDRTLAAVAVGVGAVALLLGWYGMSGSSFPAQQLPYIVSGGMFGLFAVGIGATLWLSADLRDEWRKLDRIESRMNDIAEQLAAGSAAPSHEVSGPVPAARPRRSRAVAERR